MRNPLALIRPAHPGRHRAVDAVARLTRELAATKDWAEAAEADSKAANELLALRAGELADHKKALEMATIRIADLEEGARQAADLNARSLHVPPAAPVEPNDATQPMDTHTLRAAVGTGDNPRENWARPVTPVIPLHGAFGPAHPGPVDGDTTLTIPLPNAA